MQVLQDVYNEVTGRTETLSKSISINHRADFESIRQLNKKIEQLCEQYNITTQKCSVTIFLVDDQREVFSSFERFSCFDGSNLSPTESVHLEYEFLIILPKSARPQPYKLEIHVNSRVATWKSAQQHDFQRQRIFFLLPPMTGHIEVEYVDYNVARNFVDNVDKWFEGLPKSKTSTTLRIAKTYSHYLSTLLPIFSVFVVVIFSLSFSRELFDEFPEDESRLFSALALVFGAISILGRATSSIGQFVGEQIHQLHPTSYITLNRGDEILVREFMQFKARRKWAAFTATAIGFSLSVGASIAAHLVIRAFS